jgi:hypothetical protein
MLPLLEGEAIEDLNGPINSPDGIRRGFPHSLWVFHMVGFDFIE